MAESGNAVHDFGSITALKWLLRLMARAPTHKGMSVPSLHIMDPQMTGCSIKNGVAMVKNGLVSQPTNIVNVYKLYWNKESHLSMKVL